LAEELHTEGPLKGWKVEYIPDTKGQLGMIRAGKTGEVTREFVIGYDVASRLSSSTVGWSGVPPMAASYGRDSFGNLQTFSRGGMTTTLTHDPANNRLTSVENVRGSTNYAYTYSAYDSRHRIGGRFASHGASWGSLSYDNADRLGSVSLPRSQFKTYAYDSRNNRTGQFAVAALTVNAADQLTGKTLTGRGFGVSGKVRPAASVQVFHSLTPGTAFSPWLSSLTGDFGYATSVPPTTNNGAAVLVEAKVRGIYTQAGQPTAIAEGSMFLRVPPMAETINYDGAGRQIEDAYWTYTWDPAGRLTKKTAKLPAHPNASAETVDCVYDADNRRIQKTHTITFTTGAQLRERSTVVWAGDFELCETLERTGKPTVRKWFQRGVDVSGTLSGAAGIGGLVAIHEESPVGTWKRTLLPVNDGIGNVTIVLNAANGARVATYDYGPFGEPLGETGEADACPFRWQTRWYDRESEHYHFKEREYEPKTGRWLSMDPLREGGGLNYYAYCGNDPVNRHDPLGLADDDFWGVNPANLARIREHLQEDHQRYGWRYPQGAVQDPTSIIGQSANVGYDTALGMSILHPLTYRPDPNNPSRVQVIGFPGNAWFTPGSFDFHRQEGDVVVPALLQATLAASILVEPGFLEIGATTMLARVPAQAVSGRVAAAVPRKESLAAIFPNSFGPASVPARESLQVTFIAGGEVPGTLRAGQLVEAPALKAIGSTGKVVFRPSPEEMKGATFKLIVGDAKFTATGTPRGTVFDGRAGIGLAEIKSGASVLSSSYQLRLQTYASLIKSHPFTIYTSRPVNAEFGAWLRRWGVSIKPIP
jgi:RHS repeat-associated protein